MKKLLTVLLLALPSLAFADYTVEVIVFLNDGSDKFEETPIQLSSPPQFGNATAWENPSLPAGFNKIPASGRKMSSQYRRLERSSRYTPLLHVAWQQPKLREAQRQPLYFNAPATNGISLEGTIAVYKTSEDLIIESNIFALERLGTVPLDQTSGSGFGSWQAWRTKEKRDVSSLTRLQYFDNPVFGVLVRLRSISTANEAPAASNQ